MGCPGTQTCNTGRGSPKYGDYNGNAAGAGREAHPLVALDDASAIFHLDLPPSRSNANLGRQADERIASETLAADDRFEQEAVRPIGQLDVERQRGIEVRERLEDERYAVKPLRGERAKFGFGHDAPTIL